MTKQKIATAIATGALLLNSLIPLAFADTKLEISGNGSSSENEVEVEANHTTTVVQNNTANVVNNVSSNANTGGNDANDNTGGDVIIDTGNATSKTNISNVLNKNIAKVENCDCDGGKTKITIAENGSYSDNKVDLDKNSTIELYQSNDAYVYNDVDAKANTGKNDANRNTGGDVLVQTGHASTDVNVLTKANANIASVGGDEDQENGNSHLNNGNWDNENGNGDNDNGHKNGGKTALRIIGNGSYSENEIEVESNRSIALVQDNFADVYNDVDAKANTGKNDANDNTGGEVVIDTGNATADVDIWNKLNFNVAEVGCGCEHDLLGKIFENGYDSDNDIVAEYNDDLSVFQDGNEAYVSNDVDSKAKTGKNDANRNTGDSEGFADPAILTGDAKDYVNVWNEANVNWFSQDGDLHLDWEFDLGDLWGFLPHGDPA